MIKMMKNKIVIEGYIDNVFVKLSIYEFNWDLFFSRVVSVVRYFVEEKGMDFRLFLVIGCGEY